MPSPSPWRHGSRPPGLTKQGGGERGAFELPCLENAAIVYLDLGFLGLALPLAGTFARLTGLFLIRVRFQGASALGDLVSSPRCPSLRKLIVYDARVPGNFTIHSKSLLKMELRQLDGLQKFIIDAPALKELRMLDCFSENQPAADISAPQLVVLEFTDRYDPSSIKFSSMALLQQLATSFFLVYGPQGHDNNRTILELLARFRVIHELTFTLAIPPGIGNYLYLMEDITVLPRISSLTLIVFNSGHTFGASVFHVLRNCTGLRSLSIRFDSTFKTVKLIWWPEAACQLAT
ncbi:hypothetical protein EJB05_13887 [Eragrostis curvula]|uniref:F-box/LRR-repeat protein 15/At3g58940/PEG3-like LRR domain-containing protein n=1 Tax=Eragrostis curvula TaxID=38414 RepID=A0A5J9VXJ4_9POAL|nr:hypothetical protein EJB05_13887 [Eragrostis curvula]